MRIKFFEIRDNENFKFDKKINDLVFCLCKKFSLCKKYSLCKKSYCTLKYMGVILAKTIKKKFHYEAKLCTG